MFKIGIIGNGFVGKATNLLTNKNITSLIYDKNPELCLPKNTILEDLNQCDIIFICVPTPMNKDGSIHLDIVESVISELKLKLRDNIFLVVRSTVLPGTCLKLGTFFMPEFLTENNFEEDFKRCREWIFGLSDDNEKNILFEDYINKLFKCAFDQKCIYYNKLTFVQSFEAEIIKYMRNTFLATKVAYCNEIYSYCHQNNIDYNLVKNLAFSDKRIGLSHTDVPGPDGKFGYGGTCFPKDCYALLKDFEQKDIKSYILKNVLDRNNEVDRKGKEWEENKGRSVI
jgi:nucleotide sugar dehydrogenase